MSSLHRKITQNKSKPLLFETELNKLKTFDSIYFVGKSHFEEDDTQNYLVFQPMYRYFKRVSKNHFEDGTQNYLVFQPRYRYFKWVSGVDTGNYIYFWKSKGLSDENTTAPTTSNYSLNPQLSYLGTKTRLEFKGSSLNQDKVTYDHGKVVNIYIAYEISKKFSISIYPTLENCLVRAVSLTKTLILININILDMELDLTDMVFFRS